jgi:hypothetical protein
MANAGVPRKPILKPTRPESLTFHLEPLSRYVLGPDTDPFPARHLFAESRQAETTFLLALGSFNEKDIRVYEHDLCVFILPDRGVDDGDALTEPDLRRGQSDSFGRIHRLEHVGDQLAERGRAELIDYVGGFLQHRAAILNDVVDHQNCFTCSK